MSQGKLISALTLAIGLIASTALAVLPQQFKSSRMSNSTSANQIDDKHNELEQAVSDILGVPIDTNIGTKLFVVDTNGLRGLNLTGYNIADLPTADGTNGYAKLNDGSVAGAIIYDDGSNWRCLAELTDGTINPLCPPYNVRGDLAENTDGVTDGTTNFTSAARACAAADVNKTLFIADAMNNLLTIADGNSTYEWIASGSGTNEYYVRLKSGGADPELWKPERLLINSAAASQGTLGSIAAGGWGYGDNDSLGYWTTYVRLSDGADPDSKASGFVQQDTYSSLVTTVSACSGNAYTLAAAPDRTATSLKWSIGTDDTTGAKAAYAQAETTGGTVYWPEDAAVLLTDELDIDTSSGGANTGKDITVICDPGATLYRAPSCNLSTCVYDGSQAFVTYDTTGKITSTGCTYDGNNEYEGNNHTSRITNVKYNGRRNYITNTRNLNALGYAVIHFSDSETELKHVYFADNEIDGCWEGGHLIIGTDIGSATEFANLYRLNNKIHCPVAHPNVNALNIQGTDPVIFELQDGVGNLALVDNDIVSGNNIVCGGDKIGDPVCLSFSPPNTNGEYLFRNQKWINNVVRCSDTGNAVNNTCTAEMIRTYVGNRDTAGDDLTNTLIEGNTIINESPSQGTNAHIEINTGMASNNKPTNRFDYLTVGANFAPTALSSQNHAMIDIQDDWHRVTVRDIECNRSKTSASTNFTGCVNFSHSVVVLSQHGIGGWNSNNLNEVPISLTDSEVYGFLPGQWWYIRRAAPDDGDLVEIGSFASAGGCYEMYVSREDTYKSYDFCANRNGTNSDRVLVPNDQRIDADYDFHVIANESDTSKTSLSIWQRDGSSGGEDYIVGIMVKGMRDSTDAQPFTPLSTDQGATTPSKQPFFTSRPVLWKWTVEYTDFVAAAVTDAETVLTIPSGWVVRQAYAEITTTFACSATCTTGTLSMELGDSDDANGYLLSFDADAATGTFGDASAEVGVYNPQNAAPDGLVVWGGYVADQAGMLLTLTSGTGNIGDGSATNLSQGQVVVIAELFPMD